MKVVEGLKQGNECLEQMHKVVLYLFSTNSQLLLLIDNVVGRCGEDNG